MKYATTSQTEHQITDLKPETGYQVFVVAYRSSEVLGTYTIKVATLASGESKDSEVTVTLPPSTPEVSISADGDITKGSNATFTITANPTPATDLRVSITVTQNGDYGAATGQQTITIPTAGSVTLTVSTTGDDVNEADGSVTVTVNADYGYTVSATQGDATVTVADNDVPEVSITTGSGIIEGSNATFTITANPTPATDLRVSITVTQNGDYGAATGQQTITIPTTGTATLTVTTIGDTTDEPDGSITATVNTGNGYTVSSSQGEATVNIADDDPAPEVELEVELSVIVENASATEGDILVFRVRLSRASAEEIRVDWSTAPAYHVLGNRAHMFDYQHAFGVMVFEPGVTMLEGEVWLEQDGEDEPDEYFAVEIYLPGGTFYADAVGTMTIVDDD